MALFYDRVRVATATTGTANVVPGSAFSGFRSFVSANVTANTLISYGIEDINGGFEVGTGLLNTDGSFYRRSVSSSSANNALINLSGNASVFLSPLASDLGNFGQLNSPNTWISPQTFSGGLVSSGPSSFSTITSTSVTSNNISVSIAGGTIKTVPGNQSITPGLLISSNNHATSLLAGSSGTALVFDNSGFLTIGYDSFANISSGTLGGTITNVMQFTSSGFVANNTAGQFSFLPGGSSATPMTAIVSANRAIGMFAGVNYNGVSYDNTGYLAFCAEPRASFTGGTLAGAGEVARFDYNGNFGIGTTAPAAKLDVRGPGQFSSLTSGTPITLNNGANNVNYGIKISLQDNGTTTGFLGSNTSFAFLVARPSDATSVFGVTPSGTVQIPNATFASVNAANSSSYVLSIAGRETGTVYTTIGRYGGTTFTSENSMADIVGVTGDVLSIYKSSSAIDGYGYQSDLNGAGTAIGVRGTVSTTTRSGANNANPGSTSGGTIAAAFYNNSNNIGNQATGVFAYSKLGNPLVVASSVGNTFIVTQSGNMLQGNTTSSSSNAPIYFSLGGSYSSTAGSNAKLKVYDDGSAVYGFGVSSSQLDYIIPSGATHAWWNGTVNTAKLSSSLFSVSVPSTFSIGGGFVKTLPGYSNQTPSLLVASANRAVTMQAGTGGSGIIFDSGGPLYILYDSYANSVAGTLGNSGTTVASFSTSAFTVNIPTISNNITINGNLLQSGGSTFARFQNQVAGIVSGSAGIGVEIGNYNNTGFIQAYDRSNNVLSVLGLSASTVNIPNGGLTVAGATLHSGGQTSGFRASNGAAITLQLSDAGGLISMTQAVSSITIPLNSSVAFPLGTIIKVMQWCGAPSQVVPSSNTTLFWYAGNGTPTGGTRTLANGSAITLTKTNTDQWTIDGQGIS